MAYTIGFDGVDLNSPISEITVALRDLEALPASERNGLQEMSIAYLKAALRFREEESAAENARTIPAS